MLMDYKCSCCDQMKKYHNSVWRFWAKKNGISVRICKTCNKMINYSQLKTVRGFINSNISTHYLIRSL